MQKGKKEQEESRESLTFSDCLILNLQQKYDGNDSARYHEINQAKLRKKASHLVKRPPYVLLDQS